MTVNAIASGFSGRFNTSNADPAGEASRFGREFTVLAQAQTGNSDAPAAGAQAPPASATGAHGVTTIHHSNGRTETREGGSRAWRDNNPGNLEYGAFARNHGAIGHDTGTGHHEAIFPDRATGDAAQRALLRERFGDRTVRDTMYVYAPPTENDTEGYLQFLERNGVDRNAHIRDLTDGQFNNLVTQIQDFEGWRPGTIRPES
jgi:hypothetical protein